MLTIVKKTWDLPPNTIKDIYDSVDTFNSPTWRVENLTAGTLRTIPNIANNLSDGYYCKATMRFGAIQNNTEIIREYPEANILAGDAGVANMVREINLSGLDGSDTEGVCDPEPNFSEGGHSFYVCDESGGANRSYRVEMTRAELVGTDDIPVKGVRNRRTHGATATGNNEGSEGVDRDRFTETIFAVQEGRQTDDPIAFEYAEPTNRDVDYIHTDPELTVTTPYDADAVLDAGHDQSSILYHVPTDTLLVLSEIGDTIYQIDRTTELEISRFDVSGLTTQPEGLTRYGDDIILWSEANEYMILTYVVT